MQTVRAKKHLGQHFLHSEPIAERIVESLFPDEKSVFPAPKNVLEIGPGMGVLTKYLITKSQIHLRAVELDEESVEYLKAKYPEWAAQNGIVFADFLGCQAPIFFESSFAIIGNFPYNISSQILFHVLTFRNQIPLVVGMFQKEVAERIAAPPGSKTYGILSVLLQAYYHIEYLFTVEAGAFTPPPKVRSGVIRLRRNDRDKLNCDEKLFTQVVKTAFNQRRKTLRNALRSMFSKNPEKLGNPIFDLRAERLTVEEFVEITKMLE